MQQSYLPPLTEIKVISSLWAEGEKEVNKLLSTGGWFMISASSGIDRDGYPIHQWVMGKLLQFE
ncbi:hypothetical protein [Yersinia kristensenii]|uniref:hypothetical protein n=1 Tax=Yersinia kristensenii TaxID=28152 RepID=UPI000C15498B|nr:hypothetical protein [Yersinia kristensenii]MDA5472336.1 hypothetical protein [Yersinia kristensenii]MDA5476060.1 hypothetical protein [Yersinia kristensenii]MDA5507872.1 hypothetical protein [Yersinia kristensenii]MDA5523768.1 hypothetical protein [Yersinia kristensenii]MDR4895832.1 hypothetical protein [Yersinia kristensenii]